MEKNIRAGVIIYYKEHDKSISILTGVTGLWLSDDKYRKEYIERLEKLETTHSQNYAWQHFAFQAQELSNKYGYKVNYSHIDVDHIIEGINTKIVYSTKFVMIKKNSTITIPKGHIELCDKDDMKDTVIRETEEEIGFRLNKSCLVSTNENMIFQYELNKKEKEELESIFNYRNFYFYGELFNIGFINYQKLLKIIQKNSVPINSFTKKALRLFNPNLVNPN